MEVLFRDWHALPKLFTAYFIPIALSLLLTACAAPSASYRNISVTNTGPTPAWKLGPLPSSGKIHIDAVPVETATNAAKITVDFKFNSYKSAFTLSIYDPKCRGNYDVAVEYASGDTVSETVYLKTKPLWGKPLGIDIDWSTSNAVSINLNGEAIKLKTVIGPQRLNITSEGGGIEIRALDYVNQG